MGQTKTDSPVDDFNAQLVRITYDSRVNPSIAKKPA